MTEILQALSRLLPEDRVSAKRSDLEAAGRDESALPPGSPDAVVWPISTPEVAALVAWANETRTPLTARGAGSSLEGNPIPARAGVVLDFTRMNRIRAVRLGDLQVDVEPGLVYDELNRQVRRHGLFFPPSPGGSSDVATVGGMVANNASGIYSPKYGGTRSHVRAATAVTGMGTVLHLGNRCRKHSTGYDLLDLLVGSEGTLAILTEITLSLAGLPPGNRRWVFAFADDGAAAATIAELLRFGVDLAAAEFLDRWTVNAINQFRRFSLPVAPMLFLEVHGSAAALVETASVVEAAARAKGGKPVALSPGQDPWKEIRHYATRAVQSRHPEAAFVRADLAVPISALAQLVERCTATAARHGREVFLFGHAGIGVLHVLIPAGRDSPESEAAEAAKENLVDETLALGGAVSGEHGMGLGNRRFAERALGPALELMKQIKTVFDPNGILNPGKIWE